MENSNVSSDFLNPKSMLTPGLAGILVMALANSVSNAVQLNPIYIALALSFLVGTLIFQNAKMEWIRAVYYILNSLIIFNMALGGNVVGMGIQNTQSANLSIVSTAFAQSSDREQQLLSEQNTAIDQLSTASDDATRQHLLDEIKRINREIAATRSSAQTEQETAQDATFFKPWKF